MLILGCCTLLYACGGNSENAEYESYYDQDKKDDTTAIADDYVAPAPPQEGGATSDSSAIDAKEKTTKMPADATTAQTTGTAAATASADVEKGKKLIAQSDCLSCHKDKEKLVGPAYSAVADKYEANDKNISYLVQKIQKGGSGVWGQIPMTPHPNLSNDDTKAMVHYILSLKSKS